jgi:hypothetical protein
MSDKQAKLIRKLQNRIAILEAGQAIEPTRPINNLAAYDLGVQHTLVSVAAPLQDLWHATANIEVLVTRLRETIRHTARVGRLADPNVASYIDVQSAALAANLAKADPPRRKLAARYGEEAIGGNFSYAWEMYNTAQDFINGVNGAEDRLIELAKSDDRFEMIDLIDIALKPRNRPETAPRALIYDLVQRKRQEERCSITKAAARVSQDTYATYGYSPQTVRAMYYEEREAKLRGKL